MGKRSLTGLAVRDETPTAVLKLRFSDNRVYRDLRITSAGLPVIRELSENYGHWKFTTALSMGNSPR